MERTIFCERPGSSLNHVMCTALCSAECLTGLTAVLPIDIRDCSAILLHGSAWSMRGASLRGVLQYIRGQGGLMCAAETSIPAGKLGRFPAAALRWHVALLADRERAAGYYSEMPFAAAQVLVEIPYLLAQAVLFSAISYWMVGFEANAGEPQGSAETCLQRRFP